MHANNMKSGWDVPPKVAGGLLLLLGVLKCVGAALDWPALEQRTDPVLGLPLGRLMVVAGLIECWFASALLAQVWRSVTKAWTMVLLALGWLTYQWFHAWSAAGGSCPCLGRATTWLPGLAQFEREVLLSLTLWFFLVGLVLIIVHDSCKPTRDAS